MASRASVSAGGQHHRSSQLAKHHTVSTPVGYDDDELDARPISPRPTHLGRGGLSARQVLLVCMILFAGCGFYYSSVMMGDGPDGVGGSKHKGMLTPAAIARLKAQSSKPGEADWEAVGEEGEGEEEEAEGEVTGSLASDVGGGGVQFELGPDDIESEEEEPEAPRPTPTPRKKPVVVGADKAAKADGGDVGEHAAGGEDGGEEEEEEEEEDEDGGGRERPIPAVKDGTYTPDGQWRFSGGIWRRVTPLPGEAEGETKEGRAPRSWFDRRTVQARLDFNKYINCKDGRRDPCPTLEGIPIKNPKLPLDEYIIHQGNFDRLGKGPTANRTQRIRNVELLPPDGENTLLQHNWGYCAVVGNSGILRYTDYSKSIDSHDTVFRLNQAPTYGYSRRVGRKVTHRLLNKLWTRTYRNGGGMKKGVVLPMEKDLTFVVTRATSQEYELLTDFLADLRPDVTVLYLSSRTTSMSQPLMMKYRERLCHAGYGPYKGLNVPSSGYVAIYMLLHLCKRVTVYGFGVEGMGQRATRGGPGNFNYHYYKGVGSRHTGDDVHSFDTEEKLLQQLGREGAVDFCTFVNPANATENWSCGCRHMDLNDCRPNPRPHGRDDDDDCDGEECEVLSRQRKDERAKKEASAKAKEGAEKKADRKKRPSREH